VGGRGGVGGGGEENCGGGGGGGEGCGGGGGGGGGVGWCVGEQPLSARGLSSLLFVWRRSARRHFFYEALARRGRSTRFKNLRVFLFYLEIGWRWRMARAHFRAMLTAAAKKPGAPAAADAFSDFK